MKGFHCPWTLYFIYFITFNTNSELFAIFSTLSVDIFRLNSGFMTIPILQSTRCSRLMSSLRFFSTNHEITFPTSNDVMERRSSLFSDTLRVISMMTVNVLVAMLLNLISIKTSVYLETVFFLNVFFYHCVGHTFFQFVVLCSFLDFTKRYFTLAKIYIYVDCTVWLSWESSTTVSTCGAIYRRYWSMQSK